MRTGVVSLFGGLAIPRVVRDLAETAGVGRRAVERAVAVAGLRSVKRLLDVARVARAWDAMTNRRRSLEELSSNAGFPSVRTLIDHFHFFAGVPPRRSRSEMDSREFAGRLVLRLLNDGALANSLDAPREAVDRAIEFLPQAWHAGVRRDSALGDANAPPAT